MEPVLLRHAPTGRVLMDGAEPGEAIRFATHEAADGFRVRFLDEAGAWEVSTVPCAALPAA